MKIEVVIDTGDVIKESLTWVAWEDASWIDIKRPALYRHEIENRHLSYWMLTDDVGAASREPYATRIA